MSFEAPGNDLQKLLRADPSHYPSDKNEILRRTWLYMPWIISEKEHPLIFKTGDGRSNAVAFTSPYGVRNFRAFSDEYSGIELYARWSAGSTFEHLVHLGIDALFLDFNSDDEIVLDRARLREFAYSDGNSSRFVRAFDEAPLPASITLAAPDEADPRNVSVRLRTVLSAEIERERHIREIGAVALSARIYLPRDENGKDIYAGRDEFKIALWFSGVDAFALWRSMGIVPAVTCEATEDGVGYVVERYASDSTVIGLHVDPGSDSSIFINKNEFDLLSEGMGIPVSERLPATAIDVSDVKAMPDYCIRLHNEHMRIACDKLREGKGRYSELAHATAQTNFFVLWFDDDRQEVFVETDAKGKTTIWAFTSIERLWQHHVEKRTNVHIRRGAFAVIPGAKLFHIMNLKNVDFLAIDSLYRGALMSVDMVRKIAEKLEQPSDLTFDIRQLHWEQIGLPSVS